MRGWECDHIGCDYDILCRKLCRRVADLIALALNLEEKYFDKPGLLDDALALIRLLHYSGQCNLLIFLRNSSSLTFYLHQVLTIQVLDFGVTLIEHCVGSDRRSWLCRGSVKYWKGNIWNWCTFWLRHANTSRYRRCSWSPGNHLPSSDAFHSQPGVSKLIIVRSLSESLYGDRWPCIT